MKSIMLIKSAITQGLFVRFFIALFEMLRCFLQVFFVRLIETGIVVESALEACVGRAGTRRDQSVCVNNAFHRNIPTDREVGVILDGTDTNRVNHDSYPFRRCLKLPIENV